jgi:mono/diheme cytochrome c family protein
MAKHPDPGVRQGPYAQRGRIFNVNRIKNSIALTACILLGTLPIWAQETGADLFQSRACIGCHTIGKGKLVGPDLAGVTTRRSEDWIIRFVQGSQAVIQSGDADAVALSNEFPGLVMPDNDLSADQIRLILRYIEESAGATPAADAQATETAPVAPASPEMIALGRELFQGNTRLANGGPACISCHHVKNDAVIGGGILARELTTVFSRMGEAGVASILGKAPFPVMDAAYQSKPLTSDEITALVGFLQDADANHLFQHPRDYGWGLLISGIIGAALLLAGYAFLGGRRKKQSVNQAIYDRQISSL